MEKPIKITNAKIKKIIISFMGNFIKQTIVNYNKNKRKKFNFNLNYFSDEYLRAKKLFLNEVFFVFFFKIF